MFFAEITMDEDWRSSHHEDVTHVGRAGFGIGGLIDDESMPAAKVVNVDCFLANLEFEMASGDESVCGNHAIAVRMPADDNHRTLWNNRRLSFLATGQNR